jgi:hypothetical protein
MIKSCILEIVTTLFEVLIMLKQKCLIFLLLLSGGVSKPASKGMLENAHEFGRANRWTIASIGAFLISVEYDRKKQLSPEQQVKIGYWKYLKKMIINIEEKGLKKTLKQHALPSLLLIGSFLTTGYEQWYKDAKPQASFGGPGPQNGGFNSKDQKESSFSTPTLPQKGPEFSTSQHSQPVESDLERALRESAAEHAKKTGLQDEVLLVDVKTAEEIQLQAALAESLESHQESAKTPAARDGSALSVGKKSSHKRNRSV